MRRWAILKNEVGFTRSGVVLWLRSEKIFGHRIREAQPERRQAEPLRVPASQTSFGGFVHFRGPFLAEVEARGGLKQVERPAGGHAQTEGGRFSRASQRGEFFAPFDWAAPLLQSFAVQDGVRPVFRPNTSHVSCRAGTETVKIAAAPIVDVVAAGSFREFAVASGFAAGEIRHFILFVAAAGCELDEFVIHVASEIFVQAELSDIGSYRLTGAHQSFECELSFVRLPENSFSGKLVDHTYSFPSREFCIIHRGAGEHEQEEECSVRSQRPERCLP